MATSDRAFLPQKRSGFCRTLAPPFVVRLGQGKRLHVKYPGVACQLRQGLALWRSVFKENKHFRRLHSADSHADGLLNAVRENRKFPIPINVIWVVQPRLKKYSASVVGQITGLTTPVSPDKRGGSRSSRTLR